MSTQKDRKSEKSADNPLTPYNTSVAEISPGIYAIGANPAKADVPDDIDSDLKLPRVQTLLTTEALANRIKDWENKLIMKKVDPWQFFHAVGVKIPTYDGKLIHCKGGGFAGTLRLVFWNFIEPFLKRGIDEWLEHIANLCLQSAKEPKPYLHRAWNSLNSCISNVYSRMSDIDYRLRKGEVTCLASENFGKNVLRKDVSDEITFMKNYLNERYKEVLNAPTASGDKAGDNIQPTSETAKLKVEDIPDQVFICYSHKDKRWLDDLQTHLKPYVRNGSVKAWSDKQITTGSKWFAEIETALASTKVAVLLVTADFLGSDFIHENELGPLLKKAKEGKVSIIWVPVGSCAYKETPLKDYQAAGDPDKPLAAMKKPDRDKAWVTICEKIKKAVSR